jgi:hypothetical protein
MSNKHMDFPEVAQDIHLIAGGDDKSFCRDASTRRPELSGPGATHVYDGGLRKEGRDMRCGWFGE